MTTTETTSVALTPSQISDAIHPSPCSFDSINVTAVPDDKTATKAKRASKPTGTPPADPRIAEYTTGVERIAALIVANDRATGERNFDIGKEALKELVKRKKSVANYTQSDCEKHCNQIRNEVRLYVPIGIDSIKVAEFVKRHLLREECRIAIGKPLADKMTNSHYAAFISPAFKWDSVNLTGTIRDGWIDTIRDIATGLANGEKRGADDVKEAIEETIKTLAANKSKTTDDSKAVVDKLKATNKERARAATKANTAVTTAVSDAMTKGGLGSENVVSIVETVARELGHPLPAICGFDPATAGSGNAHLDLGPDARRDRYRSRESDCR